MTLAEIIEHRNVVARRLFDALCAHHPDKYVALIIPPRDAADGETDDLTPTAAHPRRGPVGHSPTSH